MQWVTSSKHAEVMKCLDEGKLESRCCSSLFQPQPDEYTRQDKKGSRDCISGKRLNKNEEEIKTVNGEALDEVKLRENSVKLRG